MFIAAAVLSLVLAFAAAMSAVGKLTKMEQVTTMMNTLGVPLQWLPMLAAAELAGAIGLIIGLWVAPLGVAAALGLVLYFVGAVITHMRAGDSEIAAAAGLGVLAALTAILRAVSA